MRDLAIREAAYLRYLARDEGESDASIDWAAAEGAIDAEGAEAQRVVPPAALSRAPGL